MPSETTHRLSDAERHSEQTHLYEESPDSQRSSGKCYARAPMPVIARLEALMSAANAILERLAQEHRMETKAASMSKTSRGAAPRAHVRSRNHGTSNIGWHRPARATPPRSMCSCLVSSRLFPLRYSEQNY